MQTFDSRPAPPLSTHILPTSGTMIGVTSTLIGLVKVAEEHIGPSRVDEYAAIVLLMFLSSAILSYVSIRGPNRSRFGVRLERLADQIFMAGLIGLSLIASFFAYEVI